MGKCTSKGCSRPMSAMSPIQTEGGPQIFRTRRIGHDAGINPASRGSIEQTMPRQTFEEVVLPHLDAAFNYARWLTKSDADAEDVVQDAYVRALRFFSSLRNDDARSWLLTIVRNTWYGRFPQARGANPTTVYDDMTHDRPDEGLDPEALVMQQQAVEKVQRAVQDTAG